MRCAFDTGETIAGNTKRFVDVHVTNREIMDGEVFDHVVHAICYVW